MARHAKKQTISARTKLLNVALILLLFIAISISLLVLPRPTVSDIEKRELTEFPKFTVASFFSGEYMQQISEFFNDTVPGRDFFKKLTSVMIDGMGVRVDDAKFYGNVNTQQVPSEVKPQSSSQPISSAVSALSSEVSSMPEESSAPESSSQPVSSVVSEVSSEVSSTPEEDVTGELAANGAIFIVKDRAMELFGGSYDTASGYAAALNAYKADLGENVNVYAMTIPLSVSFYLPEKYSYLTAQPLDQIEHIASLLNGVQNVDVYSALEAHKKEDIYFRTDHHWTSLGAYYAAQVFTNQAGVSVPDLSAYTKEVHEGYVGTMYAFTQDAVLLNNPEDFIFYKPVNEYHVSYYSPSYVPLDRADTLFFSTSLGNMYASVMGGDEVITEIKTDVKNGRKLAIFKDSYGNALVPFMTNSFEEIYVIDLRYCNINAVNYLKEKGATDVLFADCVFTACGYNARYVEQIRTQ